MDFEQNTQPEADDKQPGTQNQNNAGQTPHPNARPQSGPAGPGGNPYQNQHNSNNNSGYGYNNSYNNGYNNSYNNGRNYGNNGGYGYNNNGYPYYNRNAYQLPYAEPGSSLANASMVLGIISIVSCFTFTVYPAFILGSIAIVLALLSKGTRQKLFSKAKTGILCAVIGLSVNTVLVTSCMYLFFTNPEVRRDINRTVERQYGVSFDELMDDIIKNNGYPY